MAAEDVEASLLQAKLGARPAAQPGGYLSKPIDQMQGQAFEQASAAGIASAADDPTVLAQYEQIARDRLGRGMPQVEMTPELAAAAAYSPDVAKLAEEMSPAGRAAALEKKVGEKSKLFQERSKQMAALLDPTSSASALRMAGTNGQFGGMGISFANSLKRGDKQSQAIANDPEMRKVVRLVPTARHVRVRFTIEEVDLPR